MMLKIYNKSFRIILITEKIIHPWKNERLLFNLRLIAKIKNKIELFHFAAEVYVLNQVIKLKTTLQIQEKVTK